MDFNILKLFLCIDEEYSSEYLINFNQNLFSHIYKRTFANFYELFLHIERSGFKTAVMYNTNCHKIDCDTLSNTGAPVEYNNLSEGKAKLTAETAKDDSCYISKDVITKDSSIIFQIEYIKVMLNQIATKELASSDSVLFDETNYRKNTLNYINSIVDAVFPSFECLDIRLKEIPRWFVLYWFNSFDPERASIRLKQILSSCIETIILKKSIDTDSVNILVFYGQLLSFTLYYKHNLSLLTDYEKITKYALSQQAYCFARCCYRNDLVQDGLLISQKSLNVNDAFERANAYVLMGILAAHSGDLQLAYDTYQTWIQQKCVGVINSTIANTFLNKQEEIAWKETPSGKRSYSVIYGNLAYICSRISDTFEFSSEQEIIFYDLSIKYRLKAKALLPNSGLQYIALGKTLINDLNYDMTNESQMSNHIGKLTEALDLFENAEKHFQEEHDTVKLLASYKNRCRAIMEFILFEKCKSKNGILENKTLNEYYVKLTEIAKIYCDFDVSSSPLDDDLRDEIKMRNELEPVLNFYGTGIRSELIKEIHILLIAIKQNTTIMEEYLRRREYIATNYQTRMGGKEYSRTDTRKIAYYTTLKNFSFIFDELYLDKNDNLPKIDKDKKRSDTKNCLTVMNSKYMNDPNEGVVLLKELTKNLETNSLFSGKTANEFASSFFDETLVFLKSFTEQIDKLTMWNRYANDYDGEGKNSNGCCVYVSPECFVNSKMSKSGRELFDNELDDYRLYRVVYISTKGEIIKERNIGLHNNVYTLYTNLKMLVEELNSCLNKYAKNHSKDDTYKLSELVEKSLCESLKKIIFLFKYDDYSDEQESRLILLRDKEHQDDIRVINGELPMLAINPFFQVYVTGIILGPNVRNAEKWKPYFQYQLNRMWKRHPNNADSDKSKENYFIKYSDIKYLT